MPTPMYIFAEIAKEYGVDPNDEDAVDEFFLKVAPTLSAKEQVIILDKLLNYEEKNV